MSFDPIRQVEERERPSASHINAMVRAINEMAASFRQFGISVDGRRRTPKDVFIAKITAEGSDSQRGLYEWTEQRVNDSGNLFDDPGGRVGTLSYKPAQELNYRQGICDDGSTPNVIMLESYSSNTETDYRFFYIGVGSSSSSSSSSSSGSSESSSSSSGSSDSSSSSSSSTSDAGIIVMWSGAIDAIPSGYALCDGTEGRPDLRDRFIVGAGNAYNVADTGGYANHGGDENDHEDHSSEMNLACVAFGLDFNVWGGSTFTHSQTDNRPPYYALAFIIKL